MKLKRSQKAFCFCLSFLMFFEAVFPTATFALTGGPSQPEMQSFTPVGTSDMVDVFSGDFKYNIPLLDVGGYPINISYSAGNGMDAEASWVGLGWTLNPGVINRNARGIPDDFKEDDIEKWFNIRPNLTYGITGGVNLELAELDFISLDVSAGLTYNNYNGIGFAVSANPAISAGDANKGSMTFGLGLSAGSESGVGIQPSVSFSKNNDNEGDKDSKFNASVGLSYNSRAGIQQLTVSASYQKGTFKDETKQNSASDKQTSTSPVFHPDKNSLHFNGGSSISFSHPTFAPPSGKNYLNTSLSITAKLGGTAYWINPNGYITGSFSGQFLADKHQHNQSYGYMYLQDSDNDKNAMLDFNREKDGAVGQYTPNLPLANLTYDVYSVNGQGIGGTYRPRRSDIGIVYDKAAGNLSGSIGADVGLEIDMGNVVKVGVNVSVNTSVSESGKWTKHNSADDKLSFKKSGSNSFYEPVYFKQAGEKTPNTDMAHFNEMGGFDPVFIGLNKKLSPNVSAKSIWSTTSSGSGLTMNHTQRTERDKRNESINILTAKEASVVGNVTSIEDYSLNNFTVASSGTYKDRFQPATSTRLSHKEHHISEITAYRTDGARYVYGIPAYNQFQDEVTFNVSGRANDCTTGLVNFNSSDDSQDNNNGLDNYFERVRTPASAHAYLLTEILSTDYVDLTGNGPTDDDLGTYTKLNYTKVNANYKWRVPFQANKANLNQGLLSSTTDDKGSYVYGEKEIWYMHSIETKNFIAEFEISARDDARGVSGPQGGIDANQKNYKLDRIRLYSKPDKIKAANSGGSYTAVPIKTVHFEYNYELCPGIPNNINGNGKLTLKQVYFTYANSKKGKLSPYEFVYADKDHDGLPDSGLNPSYNMKGYDRWGNYKAMINSNFCFAAGTALNNAEYPYVDQKYSLVGTDKKYLADDYAWAWNLTSVKLPSGGEINVEYEADDYAFVQDKKAMQMFRVIGAANSSSYSSASNMLYSGSMNNSYVFIEFDNPFSGNDADFRKRFLSDENGNSMEFMYFKFLMNIDRDNFSKTANEFVPGYCRIEPSYCGLDPTSGGSRAYIKLKEVDIQDKISSASVNPIAQAGWNYARIYASRIAYAQSDPTDNGVVQLFKAMLSTLNSIRSLITGMNTSLKQDGCSKKFDLKKSFVRLFHPDQFKKGGGYRVTKIKLIDNWQTLTTPNVSGTNLYKNAEYGQEYSYTTTDKYGNTISSGVAAYEPSVGGEENPWHQPVFFEEKKLLAANSEFFQETPYGESVFPSASVGYSKVTVKNLKVQNVNRTATGKTVHEFYTGKDFPVIVRRTKLESYRHKPNPILKILKVGSKDFFTASQGYVVELNDMHGKSKAQWVYQEGKDEPISGTENFFRQQSANRLDNNVPVIKENGDIGVAQVGVDYDVTVDMRESKTQSFGCSVNGNLETALFGIIPLPLPMILPAISNEKVRTRLAVVTKVLNRYALVDKTVAYDLGSKVETYNKLYDGETGELIASETTNHFKDAVYTFNYPAHWRYEQMGGAYKNIGLTINSSTALSSPSTYFVEGDELMMIPLSGSSSVIKGWVTSISPLIVQKADGASVSLSSSTYLLKVIRSGRRNQQNIPIGNFSSKKQPWNQTGSSYTLNINQGIDILSASASELTDNTKIFCECNINDGQAYNPYVVGIKGNWRPFRQYTYLTERTQTKENDNVNIRKDGVFTSFSPFYAPPSSGYIWAQNPANWTFVNEVTIYSPYGTELENKDALNRYSSADYGYNYSLPKAVASNSKYREMAYDGFEDYDFKNCGEDHFSFKNSANANLSSTQSHTGKKSIVVSAGQSVTVKKYIKDCADCANLQVAFSKEGNQISGIPSGGIAPFIYIWTFMFNGSTSTSTGPVFNLPPSADGQAYTLSLTVSDGQNCTKTIAYTNNNN